MNLKNLTGILLLFVLQISAFAQRDSCGTKMSSFTPAFRIGGGVAIRFYVETGVVLHKYRSCPPNSMSHNLYAAVEAASTMYYDRGFLLLGPKLGYQFHAMFYAIGVETKYLSDGKNEDFVVALKAGLSILGSADLMYGYQISTNGYPFPNIGAHQLGIAFTLYRGIGRGKGTAND